MPKKKTQEWKSGSIFALKLQDDSYSLGQILNSGSNVITAAFFDIRFSMKPDSSAKILEENVIAVLKVTVNHLEDGLWELIGTYPIVVEKNKWPNEKYASNNYIGSKSYTSNIAEDLINAFFVLSPWDKYYDPNYFDKILYGNKKRPKDVILVKGK